MGSCGVEKHWHGWQVECLVDGLKRSVMLRFKRWTRYSLECKEKATCDNNKDQSHREDTTLSGHDESSVTEKPVFAGEHFPFSPRPLRCLPDVVLRGRRRHWQRPRIDLLVLAVLHGVTDSAQFGGRERHKVNALLAELSTVSSLKYQSLYADMSLVPIALSRTSWKLTLAS